MTVASVAGRPGGTQMWLRITALGVCVGVSVVACTRAPEAASDRDRAAAHRLVVTPFQTDSTRRDPMARVLADSLVARLSGMPDLAARVGPGGSGDAFVVRGDLAGRGGRLVIAARLLRLPGDSTLWTATFWRADSLTTGLLDDLASGLAEAIYGHLARALPGTIREVP